MILFDDWHIQTHGDIHTLFNGTTYIMDDCPYHLNYIKEIIPTLYGSLLVTGLGLCCVLKEACKNTNINSVICVEIEQKLIDYYKDTYPNVTFVCADAWTWEINQTFDFMWHDIFSEYNTQSINQYLLLKEQYKPYCIQQIHGLFDTYLSDPNFIIIQ